MILANGRKEFQSPELREPCKKSWQVMLEELQTKHRTICGSAKSSGDHRETELFRRCNLDQDMLNTIFSDPRTGEPNPAFIGSCPEGLQLGLATNFLVRQENAEFLKRNGMPATLDPWWMATSERARALYLIVLHADHDPSLQRQMVKSFKPYAGKSLPQSFFDNLAKRAKAASIE